MQLPSNRGTVRSWDTATNTGVIEPDGGGSVSVARGVIYGHAPHVWQLWRNRDDTFLNPGWVVAYDVDGDTVTRCTVVDAR